jgi:exodeoxyribonuclease VII small subunit
MATNRKRDAAGSAANNGSGQSPSSGPAEEQTLAFEEALGRLDETVTALESGQLPLQEALALFEEGVRLTQRCQELLDSADLRIQRLRVSAYQHASFGDQDDEPDFALEPFNLDDGE